MRTVAEVDADWLGVALGHRSPSDLDAEGDIHVLLTRISDLEHENEDLKWLLDPTLTEDELAAVEDVCVR